MKIVHILWVRNSSSLLRNNELRFVSFRECGSRWSTSSRIFLVVHFLYHFVSNLSKHVSVSPKFDTKASFRTLMQLWSFGCCLKHSRTPHYRWCSPRRRHSNTGLHPCITEEGAHFNRWPRSWGGTYVAVILEHFLGWGSRLELGAESCRGPRGVLS